jgi:hypothetical protein
VSCAGLWVYVWTAEVVVRKGIARGVEAHGKRWVNESDPGLLQSRYCEALRVEATAFAIQSHEIIVRLRHPHAYMAYSQVHFRTAT